MTGNSNDSAPVQSRQCTCHTASPLALEYDVGAGPAWLWDPECLLHDLDAQLELAAALATPAGAQVERG